MLRVWPLISAPSRASSSTGCSRIWLKRPSWPVGKEFALLRGDEPQIPRRSGMKSVFRILPAASLALGLAFAGQPALAQQQQGAAPQPLKPGTPACMAAAREILTMKNASAMYANAVPTIVQQTKDQFLTT